MIGRCLGTAIFAAAAWGVSWMGIAAAQEGPGKSPTVEAIKQRGELSCGVDTGIPGFAFQDNTGGWQGFDITYAAQSRPRCWAIPRR